MVHENLAHNPDDPRDRSDYEEPLEEYDPDDLTQPLMPIGATYREDSRPDVDDDQLGESEGALEADEQVDMAEHQPVIDAHNTLVASALEAHSDFVDTHENPEEGTTTAGVTLEATTSAGTKIMRVEAPVGEGRRPIGPGRIVVSQRMVSGDRPGEAYFRDPRTGAVRVGIASDIGVDFLPAEGQIPDKVREQLVQERMALTMGRFEDSRVFFPGDVATPEDIARVEALLRDSGPETISLEKLMDIFAHRVAAWEHNPDNCPSLADSNEALEAFNAMISRYLDRLETNTDQSSFRIRISHDRTITEGATTMRVAVGALPFGQPRTDLGVIVAHDVPTPLRDLSAAYPNLRNRNDYDPGVPGIRRTMLWYHPSAGRPGRSDIRLLARQQHAAVAQDGATYLATGPMEYVTCDKLEVRRLRNFLHNPRIRNT